MSELRDRLQRDSRGRIFWRGYGTKDIVRIIEQADMVGDVSLLKAARAALARRPGWNGGTGRG